MANKMVNLTEEKLEALRTEYKQRNNKQGKYPRQKMLPEYQLIYPWVMADVEDPYSAFCTICECRLSAKRSDLGKHESSIKHTENSAKRQPDCNGAGGGGIVLKGAHQTFGNHHKELNGSSDDIQMESDNGPEPIYIKEEPCIDLVEPSSINVINLKELQTSSVKTEKTSNDKREKENNEQDDVDDDEEGGEEDDDDEDNDDDDDDEENSNNSVYEPPSAKRRMSETDSQSQHSSMFDFPPVQVTITEGATPIPSLQPITQHHSQQQQPRYSLRKPQMATTTTPAASSGCAHAGNILFKQQLPTVVASAMSFSQMPSSVPGLSPSQTPCKITIQKVTQPRAGSNVHITPLPTVTGAALSAIPAVATVHQGKKLSSSTPVTVGGQQSCTATIVSQQQPMHYLSSPMTVQIPQQQQQRDAYELFFDSICASVKSLPPKLATEGKMRVMQLVGELELRAITERETSTASERDVGDSDTATDTTGSRNATAAGSQQQNSTVASTTK